LEPAIEKHAIMHASEPETWYLILLWRSCVMDQTVHDDFHVSRDKYNGSLKSAGWL
jgi:hypothetical protein